MTGLTPWPLAALTRSIAPASDPWSVSATAGISSSAARCARAGIRQAPSRIEYSEWTWRWTKGTVSGTGKPCYKGVPTRLLERERAPYGALSTRRRQGFRLVAVVVVVSGVEEGGAHVDEAANARVAPLLDDEDPRGHAGERRERYCAGYSASDVVGPDIVVAVWLRAGALLACGGVLGSY